MVFLSNQRSLIREVEVLRVAGVLNSANHRLTVNDARSAVLKWAQNRRGSKLPIEANAGRDFEHLEGGRSCFGVRFDNEETDLWAMRAEEPDKEVAERSWTMEIVIGRHKDEAPRFSARLFASTRETVFDLDVHVPGFLRQFANSSGFKCGGLECQDVAWWISSEAEADDLVGYLATSNRILPLVIMTTGQAGFDAKALSYNPNDMAAACVGLAHIAVLPEALTWRLSERLGRSLSVFDGGIRTYEAGFTLDDDPFGRHDLILARDLATKVGAEDALKWIKRRLAESSIRRVRLGDATVSYQDVRTAVLEDRQRTLESGGGSAEEKLAAAFERIESLEAARKTDAEWSATLETDNKNLNALAKLADSKAGAGKKRIIQLENLLRSQGKSPTEVEIPPKNWSEFAEWCDRNFVDRLILTNSARREVKDAEYEDIDQAAWALGWLAGEYRTARIEGGDSKLRDYYLEEGIKNSPCGGDSYETIWKEKKQIVGWHIKNGGNVREPRRCFRAYYFWDDVREIVVVDHLPSHRSTGAS